MPPDQATPPLWQNSRPEALVDVLDRLLDTGVVLDGHIALSVAGVDLVHVSLRALLASVDSAQRLLSPLAPPSPPTHVPPPVCGAAP